MAPLIATAEITCNSQCSHPPCSDKDVVHGCHEAHDEQLQNNTSVGHAFPERPLVEVRRGFSLGYDGPEENTSTLVLTARSGHFVDLRFSTCPVTDTQSHVKKQMGKIHGYATAGMSKVTIPRIPKSLCPPYSCAVHVRWEHTIDSSGGFETDGADLIWLANGACMEVGYMVIHGTMQMFKEYWEVPRGRATRSPCIVAELAKETSTGTKTKNPEDDDFIAAQGLAIRIGDFCQGIFQCGDEFWFERWEHDATKRRWAKDERSNTAGLKCTESCVLPCQWMIENHLACGEVGTFDGRRWNIIEAM